jgi:hypothetical protein
MRPSTRRLFNKLGHTDEDCHCNRFVVLALRFYRRKIQHACSYQATVEDMDALLADLDDAINELSR